MKFMLGLSTRASEEDCHSLVRKAGGEVVEDGQGKYQSNS